MYAEYKRDVSHNYLILRERIKGYEYSILSGTNADRNVILYIKYADCRD